MKSILSAIIPLGFLALIVLAIIYISRRTAWYFDVVNVSTFYITYSALVVLTMVGIGVFTNSTGIVGHWGYMIAGFMSGFFLYLVLAVLVVDAFLLFIPINPLMSGVAVLGLSLAVSVYGVINSYNVSLSQMNIEVQGLTKPLKVVQLTDLHLGHYRGGRFLQKVVDETNAQNADLIFLTGDFVDGQLGIKDDHFSILKQLNAPVIFVEGNHDEYLDSEAVKQKMEAAGIQVLQDEVVHFDELQVIGLDYMQADSEAFDMHPSEGKLTIKEVLPTLNIDKEKPSVLLHHAPNGVKYASDHGIDLYLAGHTHGGQIFPANLFANALFEYNKGLHKFNDTNVFVSQGIGTFGPPMRVGTKSELAVINLQPAR